MHPIAKPRASAKLTNVRGAGSSGMSTLRPLPRGREAECPALCRRPCRTPICSRVSRGRQCDRLHVVATTAIRLCNAASPIPVLSTSRQATHKTRMLLLITADEIPVNEHTAMDPLSTPSLLRGHAIFLITVAATLLAVGPSWALAQSPQANIGGTTVTGVSQTFSGALGIDFFGGMIGFDGAANTF